MGLTIMCLLFHLSCGSPLTCWPVKVLHSLETGTGPMAPAENLWGWGDHYDLYEGETYPIPDFVSTKIPGELGNSWRHTCFLLGMVSLRIKPTQGKAKAYIGRGVNRELMSSFERTDSPYLEARVSLLGLHIQVNIPCEYFNLGSWQHSH